MPIVMPRSCQIAKKDKRSPGVSRQGPGGPLWSNALHGGKRDGKSTFDVLEGRSPPGETLVAKKTNKRTVRREYTKDDVKELRAHSKARTPVVKLAKIIQRWSIHVSDAEVTPVHSPKRLARATKALGPFNSQHIDELG